MQHYELQQGLAASFQWSARGSRPELSSQKFLRLFVSTDLTGSVAPDTQTTSVPKRRYLFRPQVAGPGFEPGTWRI